MDRRIFCLSAASLASAALNEALGQTRSQAPDSIAQAILTKKTRAPWKAASSAHEFEGQMRRNFHKLIEQNFAFMRPERLARAIDNISDSEFSLLAQRYTASVTSGASEAKVLDLLAQRIDPQRLGRISMHFGFGPTYEAVLRRAPSKSVEFLKHSNVNSTAPLALARSPFTTDAYGYDDSFNREPIYSDYREITKPGGYMRTGTGQFINYTIPEIYLSFRTAPIGALGVGGSIWETIQVVDGPLGKAFGFGYLVGTGISSLIQNYNPDLWDAIGGTIDQILDNLSDLLSSPSQGTRADGQQSSLNTFNVPTDVQYAIGETQGDYQVAKDYSEVYFGGGNGCSARELFCDYNPNV